MILQIARQMSYTRVEGIDKIKVNESRFWKIIHARDMAYAVTTAVLDIPERYVLVSPRNSRIFIFSDRLLTISHPMYLVSNKVASN